MHYLVFFSPQMSAVFTAFTNDFRKTFVPPNGVIGVFEEFCDEIGNAYNADVDKILDYIKDLYIGRY